MYQLLDFIITPAHAEAAVQTGAQGGLSMLMMFGLLFFAFYLMIWRPQSKRNREQQQLMQSLAKGDEVLTAGGMLGRINKLNEQFVTIAIASDVEIIVQKSAVVTVMPKGTIKSIE